VDERDLLKEESRSRGRQAVDGKKQNENSKRRISVSSQGSEFEDGTDNEHAEDVARKYRQLLSLLIKRHASIKNLMVDATRVYNDVSVLLPIVMLAPKFLTYLAM
jgi:hypothetical protein